MKEGDDGRRPAAAVRRWMASSDGGEVNGAMGAVFFGGGSDASGVARERPGRQLRVFFLVSENTRRGNVGYLREKDGDERKDEGVAVVAGEAVVPIVFVGRCGDGLSR